MQLLQESLLDVFTTDTGVIDCTRKGGMSLAKQVGFLKYSFDDFVFENSMCCKLICYLIVILHPYFCRITGEGAGAADDQRVRKQRQQHAEQARHPDIMQQAGTGQGRG